MQRTIIKGKFVTQAVKDRLDYIKSKFGWEFMTQGMKEYFINFIDECGVPADSTAWEITDNAIVNGSYGLASDFGYTYKEAKELYEQGNLMYFEECEQDAYIVEHF